MGKANFKRLELRLEFDQDSRLPQIPYAQDVLYAMHVADEDNCYRICLFRHTTYISNTLLVASAVAHEVAGTEPISRAEALKAVARVIIDPCPLKARCLLIPGFAQAKRLLGLLATQPLRPAELVLLCECAYCQALKGK